MSRFLILGGAGDMGSAIVDDLAKSGVEEVIVGDVNRERGEELIKKLSGGVTKLRFTHIDIEDQKSLVGVMSDSDIVINAVGPFYRFEHGVIEAARLASVDYVDICDDHDATASVFESREAIDGSGSRVLVGMGWTPGITNVLARSACDEIGSPSDVNIAWFGSASDAAGLAVISHVLHAVTGDVPVYLNGKIENVPARQMKKEVVFPKPVGKLETFVVGHPEPLTFPLFVKNLKNVILRGALVPQWQNHLIGQFADIGLTETKPIRVGNVDISPRDFLASFIHQSMSQFRSGGVEASGFFVEVTGESKGKKTTIQYAGMDRMYRLTGWSASIGAQYLASHRNTGKGLFAPEGIIDPGFFMDELAKRKISVRKTKAVEEY